MALSLKMAQFGAPAVEDVFAAANARGSNVTLPTSIGKKSSSGGGGTTVRQAAQTVYGNGDSLYPIPTWGHAPVMGGYGGKYSTDYSSGSGASSARAKTVYGPAYVPTPDLPPAPGTTAPATYTPPEAFKAPVYDENKVQTLAQQIAAPTVRNLRQSVAAAQGQSYANPNVKAMTLRQALQGYGSGLESAVAGAQQAGRGLYNQEYGISADEAKTNYGTNVESSKINWQAQENYQQRKNEQEMARWNMEYNRLRDQAQAQREYNQAMAAMYNAAQ